MTSPALRPSTSRTGTPVASTSQSKHAISLEDWEAITPLSDTELRSIAIFQKACEKKPLPYDTSIKEESLSRTSAALQRHPIETSSSSGPGTSHLRTAPEPSSSQNLFPKRPIQTTQEFYDWFSMIERSVAHSQEAHYREHLATVERHLSTCKGLADNVNSVESEVNNMLDSWRSVESGGRSLKEASEQLLEERDRLIRLSEDVNARLEYFQELEHATRMLNHPGDSLVLQADFLEMVERVDICIDFLRSHRHYREAEVYLLRYQQCLTRAMTLIKMYFVGSLKALITDITKRVPDKGVSATAQMHLLYTRFQSVASQVGPLIGELERRTRSHPEELSSLLSDCHVAYFSTRKTLLIGRLSEEIKGLDPNNADLVELTRAGCSYLKQLCMDEFAIYRCFFNSGKDVLYAYLESLCDYLYDDLRPRILHEPRLTVLCDVCKVIQALMVLDVPEDDSSSDDDDDPIPKLDLNNNGTVQVDRGLGRLHISHMLQSVLQDAQTRLFFKAQTVVQSEIRYFVPRLEDINYPKILEDSLWRTRKFDTTQPGSDSHEDVNPFSKVYTYNRRETWYTALQTTASVLLQLKEFVQPSIFEDIALEAIDFCRQNITTAANTIATRTTPPSEIDAHLFIIRHLLILKEIASALNLSSSRDGNEGPIELRHVTETLRDMLRTTNLIPYAFASGYVKTKQEPGMSVNTGTGTRTGTKEGIDMDLKRACEAVIQLFARRVTQPIDDFMFGLSSGSASHTNANTSINGVTIPSSSSSDTASKLKHETTANNSSSSDRDTKTRPPSKKVALDVENVFHSTLEREVPAMSRTLRLYLADESLGDRNDLGVSSSSTGSTLQTVEVSADLFRNRANSGSGSALGSGTNSGLGSVSVLLGHIQERVVDAYVIFRRLVEFLPVDADSEEDTNSSNSNGSGDKNSSSGDSTLLKRSFSTPEEIRTLFRALT